MNKNKPLDQVRSTGVNAPNRTSKLVNKSEFNGSILNRLMNFARSVPDFRRSDKGNIQHRLADIIILMILARECGCVGRADIMEFGRLHLNKFHRLGILRNGVPSESTLCRAEIGINDHAMADRMQDFAGAFHKELLKKGCGKEIITRVRDKNLMIFNQSKDIEYWAAFQGRLIYLYRLVLLIPEDKLPA
ncbi:hypothetical protein C5O25_12660 [Paramuribaculum intestinale]|uniref:H repeat-associated protein N-terminal domain-containing protein n=2 Tax=Paramuribaculum intestinale TaxID=2094151 RepID=A0A2V1IN51_9BACT|nr:transposase family protein [Paramuribaculum intestinale]PWB05559.1 hypothetical protein C5O25_12660 [Paramuribaculum intestinale]WLT42602.1 transposase family protein [Paramuribaculum intestinale]